MRPFFRVASFLLFKIFASTFLLSAHAELPTRITGPIESGNKVAIAGSKPMRAKISIDRGAVSPAMTLEGMTLVFTRTPAQDAELKQLIADQQNPGSPLYHRWLTPAQFGERFGMSDADLAKVMSWLTSQGFKIAGTTNSHDRVRFSGTAEQVAAAFATEIHSFFSNGETHIAPAKDISLPAALASVVLTVENISDYRLKSHARFKQQVKANFTSGSSGNHYLTPKDVATIYDVNAVYNAGYTGAGLTIAVIGQSQIAPSDITTFQTAAGVAVRAPAMTLMPGTGTSLIRPGDEGESDLDLEYASGMATGATINFVYTGSMNNFGVLDALQYAIDNNLAPIVSMSYGSCELELGMTAAEMAAQMASSDHVYAQASAQGQTLIISSGDSGSEGCSGSTDLSTAQQEAVSVSFPSDSQYVTALGGSEFTAAAVAVGSNFWTNTANTDVLSSALSYMPEMVWNDDSPANPLTGNPGGLSSGGGGISTVEPRPTWQTGVPGIPTGNFRLVPDISLAASPNNAGYLYCSSDTKSTGNTAGSCVNGFRDANNEFLTVAGGTSFAAPVFAGILAVMSQKLGSGLGNINPKLYTLATNPTTYASAFHDITVGGNQCTAGAAFCSTAATSLYAAGVGYDEASGLGSLDVNNLLTAWVASTGPVVPVQGFTLTASGAISLKAGATTGNSATVTVASGLPTTFLAGFSAPVALNCTVTPITSITPSCAVSPSSVTPTTTTPATATVTITTITSQASESTTKQDALRGFGTATLAGLLVLSLPLVRRRRNWRSLAAVLFCAAAFAGLSGCGNNNAPPQIKSGGTTTGNYSVVVTGTSPGAATQTVSISLTVN